MKPHNKRLLGCPLALLHYAKVIPAALLLFSLHAAEPIPWGQQRVHPTRILARAKLERPAPASQVQRGKTPPLAPRVFVLDEPVRAAPVPPVPAQAQADPARRLRERIAALQASGDYEYVEPDYLIELDSVPSDTAFRDGQLWGLRNTGQDGGIPGVDVNADAAWALTTGSTNLIVAVVDSGIRYTHQDLAAQMWLNPGEIPGNGIDDDSNGYIDDVFGIDAVYGTGNPFDVAGHGTHVAGTIGAAANNGHPHVGVAWNVRLMAARFIKVNSGYVSDAIECIRYTVSHGARVINASWGSTRYSQALADTIAAAGDAGVLFVAAAGNNNMDFERLPNYPSGYDLENILSVAAIDRTGALATFSNYGSQRVHLGAPGVDIFSTYAGADDQYLLLRGTSMAAPHVAGVAALVWSHYPNLTVGEVRRRLLTGTTPMASLLGKTASGGRVDACRALTVAEDGVLELNVTLVGEARLLPGTSRAFTVQVSDLRSITNATVTADLPGVGVVTFLNDGLAPDVRSNDEFYTTTLMVPTNHATLTLNIHVVVPGFAPTNLAASFPVVIRPANDDFAERTVLSDSAFSLVGNNQLATRESGEPLHAGLPGKHSMWWSWTAPANGYVKPAQDGGSFYYASRPFDYQIVVYSGASLTTLSAVAAYAFEDLNAYTPFPVSAGRTYQIAVDGFRDSAGEFTFPFLYVSAPPSEPANDFFAFRQPLAGLNPVHATTNSAATREQMEPRHDGFGGHSVWWTWTAPTDARATFETAGSGFGVVAATYVGEAFYELMPLGEGQSCTNFGMPRLTFNAAAGRVYQFLVDSQTNRTGAINVSLQATPQARPANDDFATRPLLSGLPMTSVGTLAGATWEYREPLTVSGLGSIWWRWQAEGGGDVLASLEGADTNASLAVYTGNALGGLNRVDFSISEGRTAWHASAGEEYSIAVTGLGTNEPAFTVALTPAAEPVVLLAPRDRTVFAGRTLRLVAETAGAAPLSHQWLRDGRPLSDQTNATLVISPATSDLSGAYTLRVSNALGLASVTAAVTVQPFAPSVGVFADYHFIDSHIDPLLGAYEGAGLQAAIERVGYEASFVTNLEHIDVAALVIPNQRNGSMARGLSLAARAALRDFMRDGGLLLVTGSFCQRDAELLDWLFGFTLEGQDSVEFGQLYFRTEHAEGTPFASVPDTIDSDAHSTLLETSLPEDALSLFQSEDRTLVALMPQGQGAIVYLGPFFSFVRPLGLLDGGWLALLEAALRVGGPPLDRAPVFEGVPESRFVGAGLGTTLHVSAYGSAPFSYQWYRGEEALPLGTNSVLVLANVQTSASGFYYAMASNAFGVTTSEVARLTVAPPDLRITVFDHPDFVRTGGGATNESDALQASLRYLGYALETVTNFLNLTNSVVAIPSLANGDLGAALDADQLAGLSNHVACGGALLLFGDARGNEVALLRRLFGWDIGNWSVDREGGYCYREPLDRRTFFRYTHDIILAQAGGGYYSLVPETLPATARIIYRDTDDQAIVAVLPCGRGKLLHLGWNWYEAVPLGYKDYGWLEVLAAALAESSTPEQRPTLKLEALPDAGGYQLIVRGTPGAIAEVQNSVDLKTWTILNTNVVGASGVWRLPVSANSPYRFFHTTEH